MIAPEEFQRLCLVLLDRLGSSEEIVWSDQVGTVRSFYYGDLAVVEEEGRLIVQDCKDYITVWDDRLGGKCADDLQPYYDEIQRRLVLERLADA